MKLSSCQRERKANQLEEACVMSGNEPGPAWDRACLLPDKRNNMHVFYGNIPGNIPPFPSARLRLQFSRKFSKNANANLNANCFQFCLPIVVLPN